MATAIVVVVAALALAASVAAKSPRDQQYGNPITTEQAPGQVAGTDSSRGLPFTGVDLAFVIAAGAGLVAVGALARRRGRPEKQ